jgi:glycosyltransferase involved in cell wall biosynthesis
MKVAVYNAHWTTLGGGEQLAGGAAVALADAHEVELLVRETFDPIVASERLGFDLGDLPQVVVSQGTRAFLEASARYDLVVNTSFGSTFASRAPRNLYYVHFPMPAPIRSRLETVTWPVTAINPLASWIEREHGFWLREFPGSGAWTQGDATIDLVVPRGIRLPFTLSLSARPWPADRTPRATVRVGDDVVFDGEVSRARRVPIRTSIVGRGVVDPLPVRITSDTFQPRLASGAGDDRRLGIVVSHMALGRRLPSVRPSGVAALARLPRGAFTTEFLDAYQLVAANSPYTAGWVEALWGRRAAVLPPPVRLRSGGTKERLILAVGRFFPNVSGHSKKQLELVEAFRLACARGLEGWELHLVGGCNHTERGYVETVRKAAVGLPVRFHVNARGEDLTELYAAASLFWHAAGLGEDLQTHPDRFEHFGISVVEAMSAGAVPVVYEHGGPAAVVRDVGCGELFANVEELSEKTLALVADDARRGVLAAAARVRAAEFAYDHFAERLDTLVGSMAVAT